MSLANFHEVRLPLSLAFGARGGPERRTEITQLASGREARNAVWSGSRRRWDLGGAVMKLDALSTLIDFFEARRGPLHGFRFRDVFDDRSGAAGSAVRFDDQPLRTGDGNTRVFQLSKLYGETVRPILKPVAGTVRIGVDGAEITAGFTADTATGTVTFDTPPAAGAALSSGFQFDCPVRFDTDRLETVLEAHEAGRLVSVPIIELLG